ncbi:MAG TPA: Dam family site-specific DNA-(adenine-N6)-methyltransferase [Saprospiraceae bacterium]|nr:Dam family site-specific DNA-(adenine-N6)-methyltransferase [Saprospiraceae bacterium]
MRFLRYPGGKSKQLSFLVNFLPKSEEIEGTYREPFVGGGSVFMFLRPSRAIISDVNPELITLYKGIKLYPHKVWETFQSFPSGKSAYYEIRDSFTGKEPLWYKAARTLYLNRTCFKGMWRHNPDGNFNVGYGGEERRWVITHQSIIELSGILRKADIFCSDFSCVINTATAGDFIFLDPPYKPGEKDLNELHYSNGKFLFDQQQRLAETVRTIPESKKIKWAMTNSGHKEIIELYKDYKITKIPFGTGSKPGIYSKESNEVLITNY